MTQNDSFTKMEDKNFVTSTKLIPSDPLIEENSCYDLIVKIRESFYCLTIYERCSRRFCPLKNKS